MGATLTSEKPYDPSLPQAGAQGNLGSCGDPGGPGDTLGDSQFLSL